jgi:thymidylate synthase (FAD)
MILVKPSYSIMQIMNWSDPLQLIEMAGRTCYKSESKITKDSSKKFVKMITERGHESVIEHSAMTVRFICDRGVSHEIVRHRICAFSQESTRYVNYKGGCTFVIPPWIDLMEGEYLDEHLFETVYDPKASSPQLKWLNCLRYATLTYKQLIDDGWSPQEARSVLPNSTKTEIVVTANFREWKHIFKLRTSKAAHPQMRELMIPLLKDVREIIPIIFEDIKGE